jgi:hypothetical protein
MKEKKNGHTFIYVLRNSFICFVKSLIWRDRGRNFFKNSFSTLKNSYSPPCCYMEPHRTGLNKLAASSGLDVDIKLKL